MGGEAVAINKRLDVDQIGLIPKKLLVMHYLSRKCYYYERDLIIIERVEVYKYINARAKR